LELRNRIRLTGLRGKSWILFIIILLFWTTKVSAQEKSITYSANKAPLSQVLVDLTNQYGLKFAFDVDAFRNTSATFKFKDLDIESVINKLTAEYPVRFRLLEGTWIAVKIVNEPLTKEAVSDTREITGIRNQVSGYVTDALTGEPLAYCNIVTSEQRGTITNQLGYFQTETSASKLQFYISHLGYQRIDTTVAVNQSKPLTIRLQPIVILMEEVKIARKEKNLIEIGDFTERIGFNPSQSASLPRLTNDDLVNMLTVIPGVNFLNGPGGGISIRGGDPSENLILLDGIPLLETGHLLGKHKCAQRQFRQAGFCFTRWF
jgi:ferric enterobactin receptor